MISMANQRQSHPRRGKLANPLLSNMRLQSEELIRLAKVQAEWDDREAHWVKNPVLSFCTAMLAHGVAGTIKIQRSCERLLTARDHAKPSMVNLDLAARNFARTLLEAQDGIRWILDLKVLQSMEPIVGYTPEHIIATVHESLDPNLAGVVTGIGPFTCPLCRHRKE